VFNYLLYLRLAIAHLFTTSTALTLLFIAYLLLNTAQQANRAAAEHRREAKAAAKLARRWAGNGAELEQQAQEAHSSAAAAVQRAARAEAERDASRLRVLALERQVRQCDAPVHWPVTSLFVTAVYVVIVF
jgi:hypothetical protein